MVSNFQENPNEKNSIDKIIMQSVTKRQNYKMSNIIKFLYNNRDRIRFEQESCETSTRLSKTTNPTTTNEHIEHNITLKKMHHT